MACEVPVVGYQIGGVPEVVEEGVSGKLVPLYDITALAEAAIDMLAHEDRLAAFPCRRAPACGRSFQRRRRGQRL